MTQISVKLNEVQSMLARHAADLSARDEEAARGLASEAQKLTKAASDMRARAKDRLETTAKALAGQLEPSPVSAYAVSFEVRDGSVFANYEAQAQEK